MENIPAKLGRIPPVTKSILAATAVVSVSTMLGILPATSVVFDPSYTFHHKEIWRLFTTWFYSPPSEFFLFLAGLFLLYNSALNLEIAVFDGHSADFAWQTFLSAIIIMGLNIPLKTVVLSRPLLHLLIYRDSFSVKNPHISVLDLVYIPRRYLPWVLLALDAIIDGPLAFCRSLTGVSVAHIWFMLIPRPSILQMAESKTSDDQPKKPLPRWRKYAGAPGWVRKVIPNERNPRGDENGGPRSGGNDLERMITSPLSDASPVTEAFYSDCAIFDTENGTNLNNKLASTFQAAEVTPLQDDTSTPSPLSPPINRLPIEVLIRIFEFAQYLWRTKYMKKEREDVPAVWDRSIWKHMALGFPETLSHVCSLWREILLSSPQLWWGFDLYTLGRSPQTFLNRCAAFLPRTRNHELGLVVRLRHCDPKPLSDSASLIDFCTSLGPRLRSFSVDNLALEDTSFASFLIQAAISHAYPGTLTKLYIKDHIARIIPNQGSNPYGLSGWELPTAENFGISQDLLDSIVRPIRSLRLGGQFFPWTSPAYHSLIELHLQCARPKRGHRPFIHISQLREILLACPELRIFYININIIGQDTSPAPSPVPLAELEELSLQGMSRSLYKGILPLLAPGQKPLRLTIQTQSEDSSPLYCPAVLSFLQRSNVTNLYILNRLAHTVDQYLNVDQLISESPAKLVTLGLEHLIISGVDLSRAHHLTERPRLQLDCLCLRKCTIEIDALRELAKVLPARVLKLHEPIFQDISGEEEIQARQEITSMFPTVKWVRSSRDMELWHAWEVEYIE